jgi:DNA-binding NarL/FixJ family response regulator
MWGVNHRQFPANAEVFRDYKSNLRSITVGWFITVSVGLSVDKRGSSMAIDEVTCDGSMLQSNSTLLIASDHPIFVAGVRAMLNGSAFEVVGEVSSIHALNGWIATQLPDVVLLDMEVDVVVNQIASIRHIASVSKVLLMSPDVAWDATWTQELQAHAILPKSTSREQLLGTFQQLVGKDSGGPNAVPPQFSALGELTELQNPDPTLRQSSADGPRVGVVNSSVHAKVQTLTPHERTVLRYISKGFTVKQISELMNVSEQNVSTRISVIYRKTGCTNRVALVRWLYFAEVPMNLSSPLFLNANGTRKS